jgi:hypothetical protein
MNLKKGGEIEWDFQAWLIIGVIVAVVFILGMLILKGKANSAIDYVKNLLRFG